MENVVSLLNQKICSIETMATLLDYKVCYDPYETYNKEYHFIDFYINKQSKCFSLGLYFNDKKISINHMGNVIELPMINSTIEQVNSFFGYAENILAR